ncbi:LPS export ABC transporter periplasmic protein LptC [Candidatus Pelagibacter sp. HIMB1485]|uniref:LPS export ABC transporter periplasmic protein LptC n=1 Tax=Candidatus Pelagibacter sp. HIMB1485 TaxID=3415415 RepID=UPI003F834B3E
MIKKIGVFSFIFVILLFSYLKLIPEKKNENLISNENNLKNSNLLENIKYVAKDADGNEYTIIAEKGEIDINNSDVIFLENVKSLIKLKNEDEINIISDFGKYNSNNYDTIFSKNVVITYLDNKITGEYLDFSLSQNRMTVSRNVIFTNLENILESDVIELNINTKDTKIFMYEENKKVNIKSKNYSDGNN